MYTFVGHLGHVSGLIGDGCVKETLLMQVLSGLLGKSSYSLQLTSPVGIHKAVLLRHPWSRIWDL